MYGKKCSEIFPWFLFVNILLAIWSEKEENSHQWEHLQVENKETSYAFTWAVFAGKKGQEKGKIN